MFQHLIADTFVQNSENGKKSEKYLFWNRSSLNNNIKLENFRISTRWKRPEKKYETENLNGIEPKTTAASFIFYLNDFHTQDFQTSFSSRTLDSVFPQTNFYFSLFCQETGVKQLEATQEKCAADDPSYTFILNFSFISQLTPRASSCHYPEAPAAYPRHASSHRQPGRLINDLLPEICFMFSY